MSDADRHAQLRLAAQREPGNAMSWVVLAEHELDAGDAAAGESAARRALALSPGHPEALARLGRAQWMQGQREAAVDSLRAAAANAPTHPGIAVWLGHALEDTGQAEAASDAYARAHGLAPQEPQLAAYLLAWRRRLCDWRGLDALSRQVRGAVREGRAAIEPFAFLSEDASAAEQLQCARLRAAHVSRVIQPLPPSVLPGRANVLPGDAGLSAAIDTGATVGGAGANVNANANTEQGPQAGPPRRSASAAPGSMDRPEPLRVGFLSNGFGAHPTGLLTVALFENLRAQADETARGPGCGDGATAAMELHLFALNRDDGSPIRRRLHAAAHVLHDVALQPHAQVAARIRAAAIDVLFDLRGWGGGGAPEVLAMRPAPVQVNWLAYPGTSGAPWIDVVLADHFVLPSALAPHFSETVARLPRCFQPCDTTRVIPPPPSRTDCGLPGRRSDGGGVVFCCFNNSYKLNPRSVTRALAVLRGVPGSVLWLLSGPGQADARLRAFAQSRDVEPQRLVFMPKQPHADYLARLQLADLFLDTEPYNAHTTASDALWAGCPVLTRPGDTFAGRVAGSLNHHLRMTSMNVDSDAAFVARAVGLGRHPQALAALRDELALRRRDSGLFDMDGFARDFAAAVHAMATCAAGYGASSRGS